MPLCSLENVSVCVLQALGIVCPDAWRKMWQEKGLNELCSLQSEPPTAPRQPRSLGTGTSRDAFYLSAPCRVLGDKTVPVYFQDIFPAFHSSGCAELLAPWGCAEEDHREDESHEPNPGFNPFGDVALLFLSDYLNEAQSSFISKEQIFLYLATIQYALSPSCHPPVFPPLSSL